VSTLAEVMAGIRQVINRSGDARSALRHAATLLDKADRRLAAVVRGAHHPEATQALAFLAEARYDVDQIYTTLIEAEILAQAYLASIGANETSVGSTSGDGRSVAPGPASVGPVERLRAELPPDVPPPGQRSPGAPRPTPHAPRRMADGRLQAAGPWRSSVGRTRCTPSR
jgi:hypothetical protein